MFEALDRLITGLKTMRDVAQRMHDAELQSALADVTLDSAQLKADMATLREENATLREEVQKLRRVADLRSKVELRNGMYYLTERISGYAEGPFCTRCFDSDGKLITLMGPGWQPGIKYGPGTFRTDDGSGYTCPECVRLRR